MMLKTKTFINAVFAVMISVATLQGNALARDAEVQKFTIAETISGKSNNKNARPYETLIAKIANKHNVPVNLAHAVIQTESNYNPRARGADGEIGLMQLMPGTARALGFSGSFKKLYDPATNLEYGMKYLSQAWQLSGGDTCTTILKYNAGHGAKRMNPISARYCVKVKKYLASVK